MPGMTRNKYTEESAELEVMMSNMAKMQELTRKIGGSLGRLDVLGRGVQDAIRPVYGNTGKFQTMNSSGF